jgi:epoxyqueuosine reductase
MKQKMRALVADLSSCLSTQVAARWYVDDGPMLDRAAAARSGLGWFGKNTNLLTVSHGSWVFLGQIITDLPLEPDPPLRKTCGSCARCLPACPTGAIIAPYVVDNARCISYLTIEHRGAIPVELRPLMGDWVFGCDLCQEVCPVNRKAMPTTEPDLQRPELGLVDLLELLELSDAEFLRRFRGTPIMRAKRVGLQRNACVALGNRGDPAAVPVLSRLLRASDETLLRQHAAWALGRIGGTEAERTLRQAEQAEADQAVLAEIQQARRELTVSGVGD